jgi:hypothetical protein
MNVGFLTAHGVYPERSNHRNSPEAICRHDGIFNVHSHNEEEKERGVLNCKSIARSLMLDAQVGNLRKQANFLFKKCNDERQE